MSDFTYDVTQNKGLLSNNVKDYTYTVRANGTEFSVTSKTKLSHEEVMSKIKYNNEKQENEFVLCDLDDTEIVVKKGDAEFSLDENSSGNKLQFQGNNRDVVRVCGDNNLIKTGGGNDYVAIIDGDNNTVETGGDDDYIHVYGGKDNVVSGGKGSDSFHIDTDAEDTTVNAKEVMSIAGAAAIVFGADTIYNQGKMTTIKKDFNDEVE